MKITTDIVVPFDEANGQPDTTPLRTTTRRLIKVDFSALQMDDDDEEEELSDGERREVAPRPNPWQRTGTSTAHAHAPAPQAAPRRTAGAVPVTATAPLTREEYHRYCDTALECTLPPQNACRVTADCCIL